MSITMIGLDTAKSVFQVHAVDGAGQVVTRRKLRRDELIAFFGVVQSWVTREGGLALPRRMMAPSRFQRWCEYGSRCWRSGEAARE